MQTQDEVRGRFYYDSVKNTLIDAHTMRVVAVVVQDGKELIVIDGVYYPFSYIVSLYMGVIKSKKPFTGVSHHKQSGKWSLRLTLDGVRRELGYYDTQQDALHARQLIVGW